MPWDDELEQVAITRAKEISIKFSHESPDGSMIPYGENIIYGYSADPQYFVNGWMKSEGHRNTILNEYFVSTAVGCYVEDDGKVYCVQVFLF